MGNTYVYSHRCLRRGPFYDLIFGRPGSRRRRRRRRPDRRPSSPPGARNGRTQNANTDTAIAARPAR